MKPEKILRAASVAFSFLIAGNAASAAETNVAVAANFTDATKDIAAA